MAKTSGPLFSLTASGKLAGTLVYSIWKGRPYVRELVIPSNPRTEGQQNTRYGLGIMAKAGAAVEDTSVFQTTTRDAAPSGQTWISWMQGVMNLLVQDGQAVETAFAALNSTKQGYFDTGATGVGLVNYTPSWFTGSASECATNGGQLYALAYFAANYLSGDIQVQAAAALDPADQNAVDTFAANLEAVI